METVIITDDKDVAQDVTFGPDVKIHCRRLKIAAGCRIGVQTFENFRAVAGVRVECNTLELGANTVIDRSVLMRGGDIILGSNCRVATGCTITVLERLELGPASCLGQDNVLEGRRIRFGPQLWTGPQVRIGGGSCFEVHSELVVGSHCHLGMRVFINTARKVTIGNEVGLGTNTAIYTHGAYLSALDGYPVRFAPVVIGDRCWIPGAVINPGVTIGAGTVIGVGSVVTQDIPAGALAAGVPCRVLKERAFPRELVAEERRSFFAGFLTIAADILTDFTQTKAVFDPANLAIVVGPRHIRFSEKLSEIRNSGDGIVIVQTVDRKPRENEVVFCLENQSVIGRTDKLSEKVRDLLRRHGIRFFHERAAWG